MVNFNLNLKSRSNELWKKPLSAKNGSLSSLWKNYDTIKIYQLELCVNKNIKVNEQIDTERIKDC